MKQPEFIISFTVESCDEKTARNYQNCYVAEKRIVSKLSKISTQIFIAQIGNFDKDCVKISIPYSFLTSK